MAKPKLKLTFPKPPRQGGVGGKSTTPKPPSDKSAPLTTGTLPPRPTGPTFPTKDKLSIMPIGRADPLDPSKGHEPGGFTGVPIKPPGSPTAAPKLRGTPLGRANAITRGQGKKLGLKAIYAGIKARGKAAGYNPSRADVVATYRRSQKRKLAKPRA